MPSTRYNRQVALLEPSLELQLLALSKQQNLPVARLLRMSIKFVLSDKKRIKALLEFGDPYIIQE